MAAQKTLVKALRPFSHGNVDAKKGGTYAMNPADAKELVAAGFAEETTSGKPEQTQVHLQPKKKQTGDVVVDDADDLLGDGTKAAQAPENKIAPTTRNKSGK